ncbi:MAG: sigma 54-interacting transcriptional regulator, partial [Acidobacteriota bacterium]
MKYSADELRGFIDSSPTLTWSCSPDGSADFFNQRWLDYTGLSAEQARGWGWTVALHPDDLNGLVDYWRSVLASSEPGEIEGRLRRYDGVYRSFLFRATPSFDSEGRVVKWFGTNTDIEDRKRAECLLAGENHVLEMTAKGNSLESILEALCRVVEQTASGCYCSVLLFDPSGSKIQQAVAPSLPSSYNDRFPGTPVDREGGPCTEAARRETQVIVSDVASDTQWDRYGWRSAALTHGLKACWSTTILASNGLILGTFAIYWREPRSPSEQDQKIIEQISHLAAVAIERKRNEAALQQSEERFRLIVDAIPGFVCTLNVAGEVELLNRQVLEYFGKTTEELKNWAMSDAVHPEDLPRVIDAWRSSVENGQPYVIELRQRRADGVYRWFQSRSHPARDTEGRITGWYMLLTDIDDRKRAEDALRLNEQSLRQVVDSIPGFVSTANAAGEVELVNRQVLEYFGKTTEDLKDWDTSGTIHPDDLPRMIDAYRRSIETGEPLDVENRSRRADGVYHWFHVRSRPQHDTQGRIVRWYNLATDIDERKRAEAALTRAFDEIAKSEAELRTSIDAIPQLIITIGADGNFLYANQAVLEYTGLTKEEVASESFGEVFHLEDSERLRDERDAAISRGLPFEYERRVRRRDGQYRWFLVQYNPLLDERGEVIRWYATGTDIDDRKQAEERTQQENFALREQIDQAFMFEEIVGSSPALKTVLSSIVKVAPTDSTVLITGETGTGKELIARAIHKGSHRANQAFITVNCAAIPSSLIASELFGHEKGAFTGAMQRRQGRFELADSGTIFLDEVGELPAETQIALLRVIQERQFERVGGSGVIPTDVRIIAATNSDLPAAIASGTFRADLFYRLNVFPIDMPPLRQRKEDIPMLVEYFVKRYADKARKQINKIDKNTLKLCQSYHWPGNIRELQNIIERSVILCTGDTLWIDEAWLSSQNARLESSGPLKQNLQNYEKELIEAALAESNGKVAGPNGAAVKLGIPRSTLDLKIKQLKSLLQNPFNLMVFVKGK